MDIWYLNWDFLVISSMWECAVALSKSNSSQLVDSALGHVGSADPSRPLHLLVMESTLRKKHTHTKQTKKRMTWTTSINICQLRLVAVFSVYFLLWFSWFWYTRDSLLAKTCSFAKPKQFPSLASRSVAYQIFWVAGLTAFLTFRFTADTQLNRTSSFLNVWWTI